MFFEIFNRPPSQAAVEVPAQSEIRGYQQNSNGPGSIIFLVQADLQNQFVDFTAVMPGRFQRPARAKSGGPTATSSPSPPPRACAAFLIAWPVVVAAS